MARQRPVAARAAADWQGDERNVVLALARIWFSAATGTIAPKDVAANWALERLPQEHRPHPGQRAGLLWRALTTSYPAMPSR